MEEIKCWLNYGTENEEMNDGSLLSTPPARRRYVWVDMTKNLKRRQNVMKESELSVTLLFRCREFIDEFPGDGKVGIFEESYPVPVSLGGSWKRVQKFIEDVVDCFGWCGESINIWRYQYVRWAVWL